jgi:hypothetical protein
LRDAVQQLQEYFILKELILPLNSIQKELIFNKMERITIPFGKTEPI